MPRWSTAKTGGFLEEGAGPQRSNWDCRLFVTRLSPGIASRVEKFERKKVKKGIPVAATLCIPPRTRAIPPALGGCFAVLKPGTAGTAGVMITALLTPPGGRIFRK